MEMLKIKSNHIYCLVLLLSSCLCFSEMTFGQARGYSPQNMQDIARLLQMTKAYVSEANSVNSLDEPSIQNKVTETLKWAPGALLYMQVEKVPISGYTRVSDGYPIIVGGAETPLQALSIYLSEDQITGGVREGFVRSNKDSFYVWANRSDGDELRFGVIRNPFNQRLEKEAIEKSRESDVTSSMKEVNMLSIAERIIVDLGKQIDNEKKIKAIRDISKSIESNRTQRVEIFESLEKSLADARRIQLHNAKIERLKNILSMATMAAETMVVVDGYVEQNDTAKLENPDALIPDDLLVVTEKASVRVGRRVDTLERSYSVLMGKTKRERIILKKKLKEHGVPNNVLQFFD